MEASSRPSGERAVEERKRRFEEIFRDHSRAVLGYALRRVDRSEDAADALSEVMLVAWRRLDSVPGGDEARYWLIGTARRVIANQTRAIGRRERLGQRLRAELTTVVESDFGQSGDSSGGIQEALARLNSRDREVLLLNAWEGMDASEIARVLGIRPGAARTRLHRARSRFRRELGSMNLPRALVPKEEES